MLAHGPFHRLSCLRRIALGHVVCTIAAVALAWPIESVAFCIVVPEGCKDPTTGTVLVERNGNYVDPDSGRIVMDVPQLPASRMIERPTLDRSGAFVDHRDDPQARRTRQDAARSDQRWRSGIERDAIEAQARAAEAVRREQATAGSAVPAVPAEPRVSAIVVSPWHAGVATPHGGEHRAPAGPGRPPGTRDDTQHTPDRPRGAVDARSGQSAPKH